MTRGAQDQALSASEIASRCTLFLYSEIETRRTYISLQFEDCGVHLDGRVLDVLMDGRVICSAYCKQDDLDRWGARISLPPDALGPGDHKIQANLEGAGSVLSADVLIPSPLLPKTIADCSMRVSQERDVVVVALTASAPQPSFPFDLRCDQILVATHQPVIGDMVDGLTLRFALPQQLLVEGRRLFTLVPKDSSLPILEAHCHLVGVDIHEGPFKVAIVDCSLRRAAGHMYNTVNRMATSFARLGGKVEVFAHSEFQAGTLAYPCKPAFRHSCYDTSDTGMLPVVEAGAHDLEKKMTLVNAMVEELVALTPQLAGRHTIIIFPTVTPLMFLVIAKWAAQKPDDGSQVILGLMLESGAIRVTSSRYAMPYPALLVSAGMSLLSKRTTRDVHLWCVSDQLKLGYEKLAEQYPSIAVEIRPNFFTDVDTATEDKKARHVLLYVGEAKRDKGFRLLPGLLRAIRERPELKGESFVVHYVGREEPDAVLVVAELVRELCREGFNIRELSGFLDEFYYKELISSSKLILVRYDRAHYWEKSSGITWEALSFGVPVITYRNTFMANEAAKYGLPTYLLDSDDPRQTLEAIDKASARRHEDAPLCRSAAASFRRGNGVDCFAAMAVDLLQTQSIEHAGFSRLVD